MFDPSNPNGLSLVVPFPSLDDAEYCRRMATKHRDRHLGMAAQAENETDPEGKEFWLSEAERSFESARSWEARAELAERKANG
ncbi:hypothetical protein [Stappia sp.]|uniref:hypothetical protein n=1 Tax=Stappia sp. TaxID=1870903 RepID=UPI003C7ADB6E